MANTAKVSTGKVEGQFIVGVIDGPDEDDEPDLIPATGTITFTTNVPYFPVPAGEPNPFTILRTTMVGVLDDEGYLCTPSTAFNEPPRRGFKLIATDSENLSVVDWTWTATPMFKDVNGTSLGSAIPAFSFHVPSGSVQDLTELVKLPASSGTPLARGPQGDAGDQVPVTTAQWEGTVGLLEYPQTYLATLKANTTLVLPPNPLATKSGTITLVLTQDSTGGRTITWPPNVLWPEGIKPQPTLGAGTISVFHLLWSGAQWLGLVGGRAFA